MVPDGPRETLTGFSVLLTCDRRADELAANFARRGAGVIQAPTLRYLPLEEDDELIDATAKVVQQPPDAVIVTTAIGFRGWIETADSVGLAPHLLEVLAEARILARGPKARGAIRAAGLIESWSAASETTSEAVDSLIARGVAGRRVVVQLHGSRDEALLDRLRLAGAEVVPVRVYRWGPAPDPVAVERSIEATCNRTVDAVLFTSAPGAEAFLAAAGRMGRHEQLVAALRTDVVAAAVGQITAKPLIDAGLSPLIPDRGRLGALIRATVDHLTGTRVRSLRTAAGVLEVRGQGALLDGTLLTLSPAPMAILRELARRPGHVVDRATLLTALPGAGDLHAVEVAVARLRAALGTPALVQTVVKRGYRLVVTSDPAVAGEPT
ncbi:uroporphyrinogen-III synthase [Kineosporia sp. J2-2]|uniref:Uroporphyrinogen-III synthase n=1 Tax=Kineosporia corallincola TaxID=2835133 RepID=A0ABS5TIG8_9ACTN|nr:uroporphyrinogen-III synthase [Kineosporia corallincola]MBT0770663.1 uroporphyrinogen-III synthase [Kineosporia corallincola]